MHTLKFYPVGNGDTCQIITNNAKRILLDYRQHANGTDSTKSEIDLSKHLKTDLKNAKRDFFDVVAFTHADKDHIQGSTEFFYLEHAQKYQSDERIKINELWVPAAMLVESASLDGQSEEFVILRQEARYRLRHNSGIKIFSKPDELVEWMEKENIDINEREHLFHDAGKVVPDWDLESDGIEFFCHSPYKKHVDGEGSGTEIRNSAALIFNIRFQTGTKQRDFFAVGDSEAEVLAEIVEITQHHNREDRLEWDILKAAHHCSYLALNTSGNKGDKKTTPLPKVQELLDSGRKNSYIISSSNSIPDNSSAYEDLQPPHIQSRKCYEQAIKEVNGREFLVTMEKSSSRAPKPIELEFSELGIKELTRASSGVAAASESKPSRAG